MMKERRCDDSGRERKGSDFAGSVGLSSAITRLGCVENNNSSSRVEKNSLNAQTAMDSVHLVWSSCRVNFIKKV